MTRKDGVPFVPEAIWKDMFFSAAIIVCVMLCAAVLGPFGPSGFPDPTIVQTVPKPDFFFRWIYAMLALLPPEMETPVLLIAPVFVIGFLILLPFLSGEGEKSWRRRPIAVVTLLLTAVALGTFTQLASYSPWSPVMDGWSGNPVPIEYLHGRSPLERQGALVFQVKQCRNCHSIGGSGGQRGPALDRVATNMTHDQLVRQVVQGGGNMPAYGKNLNPAEVTALVSFLETLHPANQPPAHDAAQAVATQQQAPASPEKTR
jgi:ubiquinol-cytochrome c reductase cytochrome b subunit